MKKLEKLSKKRPELTEKYVTLSREELIEELCGEVLDLGNVYAMAVMLIDEFTQAGNPMTATASMKRIIKDSKEETRRFTIKDFCVSIVDGDTDPVEALSKLKLIAKTEDEKLYSLSI